LFGLQKRTDNTSNAVGINFYMTEIISFIMYFISAIAAIFFSDFFKPYLNKKAKNFATKEDFQHILEHQQITTHSIEEIKTTISKNLWYEQKFIEKRAEYFILIISVLKNIQIILTLQELHFSQQNSEHDTSIPKSDEFINLSKKRDELFDEFCKKIGGASIYFSNDTKISIDNLIHTTVVDLNFCSNYLEFLEKFKIATSETYTLILLDTKKIFTQMGLDKTIQCA
jgi:hypothetical protein